MVNWEYYPKSISFSEKNDLQFQKLSTPFKDPDEIENQYK